MKIDHMTEPLWINEPDWLCAVEFLNDEDTEGRDLAADTIGYLLGYAHLTNTRSLALLGDGWHTRSCFHSPLRQRREHSWTLSDQMTS
jgi:hypothetical protein